MDGGFRVGATCPVPNSGGVLNYYASRALTDLLRAVAASSTAQRWKG
jgi:hypothetical protein